MVNLEGTIPLGLDWYRQLLLVLRLLVALARHPRLNRLRNLLWYRLFRPVVQLDRHRSNRLWPLRYLLACFWNRLRDLLSRRVLQLDRHRSSRLWPLPMHPRLQVISHQPQRVYWLNIEKFVLKTGTVVPDVVCQTSVERRLHLVIQPPVPNYQEPVEVPERW